MGVHEKSRENNMSLSNLKSNLYEDIKKKKRKLFSNKLFDEDPNTPKKAKKESNKDQNEKIKKEVENVENIKIETNPDLECEEESLNFYSVFLDNGRHKTKLESKFWRKLDLFLRLNDFRCPALNRESYKHWPNKLPLGKKLKKLQKKFPKLAHKKSLTDKENGKILRNFDILVTFFNEDPENGGRNRIMDF